MELAKAKDLTSVQNSHPHCVNLVILSNETSARHNLQVDSGAGGDIVDEPLGAKDECVAERAIAVLSGPLYGPIGMKPPCDRFREYLDPFAANDSRLEHREQVAIDGLCRNRFNGLIGSKWLDERDKASTVSHFFMPV